MLSKIFTDKFKNKISESEIVNKNIIATCFKDMSLYWVHSLTSDSEMVYADNIKTVFYSKNTDVYFVYLLGEGMESFDKIAEEIKKLIEKNYIHFVSYNTEFLYMYSDLFESNNSNLNYSMLNYNSEILTDKNPFDISKLKNMKYLFSCTNILNQHSTNHFDKASQWPNENPDKFIMDYKYSLIYFYFKLGFNYFQKGEQKIEISNRLNKVFLYSKSVSNTSKRYFNVLKALETGKIYNKEYSDEDWFFYEANYNYYHTPFAIDYNMCKFNLVTETNDPALQKEFYANQFLSEKTVKALITSTPSYVLSQYDVYKELKHFGFYFLNEEFGEYDNKNNYIKFCDFLKKATDDEMDKLFIDSYEKSKKNKELLEKYIYSDKVKEIELLLKR
jgi:hypothetical protein